MSPRNPALKLLGLCALVAGLMAIGTAAAQAEETGGSWTYIDGSGVLKVLPNNESVGGNFEPSTDGILLTEILKKPVAFLCTSFTINESKLITGGEILFRLTFHGCIVKVGGVTQAACEPNAEGIHPGLIQTRKIVGNLLLHKLSGGAVDRIIIAKPDTGEPNFAVVEMDEECSISSEVPFGGTFALIPSNPTTHEANHLITEFAPLTHLWTISDTAEHKTIIDGSAEAFLNGANLGRSWAALWN